MNRTFLPIPPDPASSKYNANPQKWMVDAFKWMSQVKLLIEADSNVNTLPITPFSVGTYTAVNTITGTDATSNFVATLVSAMQKKGLTATRSAT